MFLIILDVFIYHKQNSIPGVAGVTFKTQLIMVNIEP